MSERVEIGKALEGELSARHGRNQHSKEVENFPPPAEGKTRDLAAKAAGFGNGKTYEQARGRGSDSPALDHAPPEG